MGNTSYDPPNKNLKQKDSLLMNPSREYTFSNPKKFSRLKQQVLTNGKWLHFVKNSHLLSLDDKFLRKCLELIHLTSSKPSIHRLSLESPKKTHFDLPLDDQNNTVLISQGTLQFTMKANEIPHFVYSLENQTDVYEASLSNVEDYTYMIYLQNRGKSDEKSSNLVGKIKVSSSNVEKEFILFSNGDSCEDQRINSKGLTKKVVEMIKNRRRSKSRWSRTSFLSSDSCSWEPPLQEPDNVKDIPADLETLAVVVKEEEAVGGWGMKFLKKSPLMRMEVVVGSGIHGGPEGGSLSLVERWKNGGKCDCGGWDLGCSLTVFNGELSRNQSEESQCNVVFDLFIKGSKEEEKSELRIVNIQKGLYLVKFRQKLTVLQSFSIALAYIHCQCLNLNTMSGQETYRSLVFT